MIVLAALAVHLDAGRLYPFVQDGECARIGIDRHTERLRHALVGDVTVGRPNPAWGEDIKSLGIGTGSRRAASSKPAL